LKEDKLMKRSIRRYVFETNSSSTHSMCITKNNVLNQKSDYIKFRTGDFGWEQDTLSSVSEKVSYLYTGILQCDREDLIKDIKNILDKNNIEYEFEDTNGDNGYVDHGGELFDFLEEVCKEENKLMRYLFSSESFVLTGNDNSESDVSINVNYDHDEYYKGN